VFATGATTIAARARLIAEWTSITIFAQRLNGIASVGLNAPHSERDVEVVEELRLPTPTRRTPAPSAAGTT